MNSVFGVAILGGLSFLTVTACNLLHDRGSDPSAARRVAAMAGGAAFLVAVLFFDALTAIAASGAVLLGCWPFGPGCPTT
jgi:hypothetical protein